MYNLFLGSKLKTQILIISEKVFSNENTKQGKGGGKELKRRG